MISAGIDVVSNANGVLFIMNDYSSVLGFSRFFREKRSIQSVVQKPGWIEYSTDEGKTYLIGVSFDASQSNILVIRSVDGQTPTSLSDLFDKIYNILA